VDADSAVWAPAALTDCARTVRGAETAGRAVGGFRVVAGAAFGMALGCGATVGDGVADGSTGSAGSIVGRGRGKLVGSAIGPVTGSGSGRGCGVEAEAAWELSDSTATVRAGRVASARRVMSTWVLRIGGCGS
jgi:hypothetical protein